MNVVLISTYELGRQPFGLASPAAWLRERGVAATSVDLSVQPLSERLIASADLVAFYVPMHTATRLATNLLEKVKRLNPRAHLCFYGLYAPVNEGYLRKLGVETILGGEFETGLVSLVRRLSSNGNAKQPQPEPAVSLERQRFLIPDRSDLPMLSKYAFLDLGDGTRRTVGYTEASRGCKHLCRHCPIVPVYGGAFRIVQRDVVLEDIAQQVKSGARHITFGDPDFFNGPAHATSIVQALHREFPDLTYDVTIKIEHLLKHSQCLPVLRDTGCLFVTSAVESFDARILEILDKGHTQEDFRRVLARFREIGLNLNPTFVAFTPWTSLEGYRNFLATIVDLDLVRHVSPIQYAIRLLLPAGSRLLELFEVQRLVGGFDEAGLCYRWSNPDPRVDQLYADVLRVVKENRADGESRRDVFDEIWRLAQEGHNAGVSATLKALGRADPPPRELIPYLSEPWFC